MMTDISFKPEKEGKLKADFFSKTEKSFFNEMKFSEDLQESSEKNSLNKICTSLDLELKSLGNSEIHASKTFTTPNSILAFLSSHFFLLHSSSNLRGPMYLDAKQMNTVDGSEKLWMLCINESKILGTMKDQKKKKKIIVRK